MSVSPAAARSHRKKAQQSQSGAAGNFDYYMLTLSWAPDYCAQPNANMDPRECGKGRHVNFVVHGLWPQNEQSRGPERCGPASPVPQDLVRVMLNYIPTEGLIQHEWANHGTCSGLSAADYFAQVRKARDSIKIPAAFQAPSQPMQLSPGDIESQFAAANPRIPKPSFHVSCMNGALQEARICLNKDLSPHACSTSAGECSSGSILIRPVL